jgi:hypothetical protein
MNHVEDKAVRLVAEERVTVTWVSPDRIAATGLVDGDTSTYRVAYSPEGRVCTCPAGVNYRACSHVLALELAVARGPS